MKKEGLVVKTGITCYPQISWGEVLNADINCIWKSDELTGSQFEGEIKSITCTGNQTILECKWMQVLKPFFDEDGDYCADRTWWMPWHITRTIFSIQDIPRRVSFTTNILIQRRWYKSVYTVAVLGKVTRFESLVVD